MLKSAAFAQAGDRSDLHKCTPDRRRCGETAWLGICVIVRPENEAEELLNLTAIFCACYATA